MKKIKYLVSIVVLLFFSMQAVKAQSSLEKKLKSDMEQSKKHRESLLLKSQEQQKQRGEEKKPEPNINGSQQGNNTPAVNQKTTEVKSGANKTNFVAGKELIINSSNKKEDINQ